MAETGHRKGGHLQVGGIIQTIVCTRYRHHQ